MDFTIDTAQQQQQHGLGTDILAEDICNAIYGNAIGITIQSNRLPLFGILISFGWDAVFIHARDGVGACVCVCVFVLTMAPQCTFAHDMCSVDHFESFERCQSNAQEIRNHRSPMTNSE